MPSRLPVRVSPPPRKKTRARSWVLLVFILLAAGAFFWIVILDGMSEQGIIELEGAGGGSIDMLDMMSATYLEVTETFGKPDKELENGNLIYPGVTFILGEHSRVCDIVVTGDNIKIIGCYVKDSAAKVATSLESLGGRLAESYEQKQAGETVIHYSLYYKRNSLDIVSSYDTRTENITSFSVSDKEYYEENESLSVIETLVADASIDLLDFMGAPLDELEKAVGETLEEGEANRWHTIDHSLSVEFDKNGGISSATVAYFGDISELISVSGCKLSDSRETIENKMKAINVDVNRSTADEHRDVYDEYNFTHEGIDYRLTAVFNESEYKITRLMLYYI